MGRKKHTGNGVPERDAPSEGRVYSTEMERDLLGVEARLVRLEAVLTRRLTVLEDVAKQLVETVRILGERDSHGVGGIHP